MTFCSLAAAEIQFSRSFEVVSRKYEHIVLGSLI